MNKALKSALYVFFFEIRLPAIKDCISIQNPVYHRYQAPISFHSWHKWLSLSLLHSSYIHLSSWPRNDIDKYLTHGTNKQIFYKIYKTPEEINQRKIVRLLKEAIKLDRQW